MYPLACHAVAQGNALHRDVQRGWNMKKVLRRPYLAIVQTMTVLNQLCPVPLEFIGEYPKIIRHLSTLPRPDLFPVKQRLHIHTVRVAYLGSPARQLRSEYGPIMFTQVQGQCRRLRTDGRRPLWQRNPGGKPRDHDDHNGNGRISARIHDFRLHSLLLRNHQIVFDFETSCYEVERHQGTGKHPPTEVVVIIDQAGLHVRLITQIDNNEYANPIRNQRKRDPEAEQGDARPKAGKIHLSVDQYERLPDQQITQARATVRHFEGAYANQVNKNPFNLKLNVRKT